MVHGFLIRPVSLRVAVVAGMGAGFLTFVERFKERVGLHGISAEGNPSGGNKFRGLYNIALKSLGAAQKKAPDVRLDGVVEYGHQCPGGDDGLYGYYFMNSPGNDLESIAGQVGSLPAAAAGNEVGSGRAGRRRVASL